MNNITFKNYILNLFLILFSLIPYNDIQAQYYLDVPVIGQKNTQWCWAASMEMIDQFHTNNTSILTHCDFVNTFEKFKIWRNSPMTYMPNIQCCNSHCLVSSQCNQPMLYSKRGKNIDYQYMDLLFSYFNYESHEDINTSLMDWQNIQDEINACRPFIMMLNKGESKDLYSHAVVAKGYFIDGNTKYVIVNDPQKLGSSTCDGFQDAIPITAFSDPVDQLNSVLEVVKYIKPKNDTFCSPCDSLKEFKVNPLLFLIIVDSKDNLLSDINNSNGQISNGKLNSYLELDQNGKKKYLSTPVTYRDLGENKKIIRLITLNQIESKLAIYLERLGDTWKVKSITNKDNTLFKEKLDNLNFPNKNINLTITNSEMEIVTFLPDYYSFYKFNYKGKEYFTPAHDYPNFELKKDFIYTERDIKNCLDDVLSSRKKSLKELLKSIDDLEIPPTKKKGFWPFRWLFNQDR